MRLHTNVLSTRTIGYVGTVERVERMRSSRNGNPRYRVHLTDGRNFPTAPDAMWAYAANNPEWRQQMCWFALEPCRLKSDAWQITYARGYFTLPADTTDPTQSGTADVWMTWHGGANYAPSGAEEAFRVGNYVSDAVDDMDSRYRNADGVTPGVTEESEGWIYLADPREDADPYPAFIIHRAAWADPCDTYGWDLWTVSPC